MRSVNCVKIQPPPTVVYQWGMGLARDSAQIFPQFAHDSLAEASYHDSMEQPSGFQLQV